MNQSRQQKKRKQQQQSYTKLLAGFLIISALVICPCMVKQYLHYQELLQEQEVVLAQIEEEKEKQAGFENRREYYHSDAYIEQVAREQLGMIKPNEILYINRSE